MHYLLIPRMQIQTANMHCASFLLGGPPVMAATLFAHALGRKVSCNVTGAALIHHQMKPLGQWFYGVFSPQQRRAAAFTFTNKNGKDYSKHNRQALSLQSVACAHMLVSVVVEIEELSTLETVNAFLFGGRLAGGQITAHGVPQLFETVDEAINAIGTGFIVIDRRDLMKPNPDRNPADLFVENLGKITAKESGNTWLSAACLGYATLTPFEKRRGGRGGFDHAFAEPLIGLVQYRQIRSYVGDLGGVIWRPQWISPDVFCVQQNVRIGGKEFN